MVTVRVDYDKDRLTRLISQLRKAGNLSLLKELPLEDYKRYVTNRLIEESPKGDNNPTSWLRYIRSGGKSSSEWAKIRKPKFSAGWQGHVRVEPNSQTLVISLGHDLLKRGLKGHMRFEDVLFGHEERSYTVEEDYRYKQRQKVWYRFHAGQELTIPAQEGTPVISRTETYIRTWLVNKMARDLDKLIQ